MDKENKYKINEFDGLLKYKHSNNIYYISHKDGFYGLLNEHKQEILPCRYEEISKIFLSYVIVKKNNMYEVFNNIGKRIDIPPLDNYYIDLLNQNAIVSINNKEGVFSFADNKMIIPINFDEIFFSSSIYFRSYPQCFLVKQNEKLGVFYRENSDSEQAILITDIKFESIEFISIYSLILFKYNNKYFFGELLNNSIEFNNVRYDDVYISYGLLFLKYNGKWGFTKFNSIYLYSINFEYDNIIKLPNNDIAVLKNNKWGMIDAKGNILIENEFDKVAGRIILYKFSLLFIKIGASWFVLAPEELPNNLSFSTSHSDLNLKLFETNYEDVIILTKSIFAFKMNGKWGLATYKTSTSLFECKKFSAKDIYIIKNPEYNDITLENEGLEYYIFNLKKQETNEIIKVSTYSSCYSYKTLYCSQFKKILVDKPFSYTITIVFSKNSVGYVDKILNGNNNDQLEYEIFDLKFKKLNPFRFDQFIDIESDNYVIFKKDNKYGVLARTGDIVVEAKYKKLFVVGNTICYSYNEKVSNVESISDSLLFNKFCTRCNRKMILRKNTKDDSLFWGCSNFPECKCTIEWEDTIIKQDDTYLKNKEDYKRNDIENFLSDNDYENTKEQYKVALNLNPNDADTHFDFANLLEKHNDFEGAKKHYEIYLKLNQNDEDAHCFYAIFLTYRLNDYNTAMEHYEKAISINPSCEIAHSNLANLLLECKNYEGAKEHYDIVLKLNPNDDYTHKMLANILVEHYKDYDSAVIHYERVIELTKNLEELKIEIEKMYNGDKELSNIIYNSHLDSLTDVHYKLANILFEHKNDYEAAKEHYDMASILRE